MMLKKSVYDIRESRKMKLCGEKQPVTDLGEFLHQNVISNHPE